MVPRILCLLVVFAAPVGLSAQDPGTKTTRPEAPAANGGDFSGVARPEAKVPQGVLLVKGAWASASDTTTPLPEGANVANHVFDDKYFGMSYTLPADWIEKYKGPPPSPSGLYVLAEVKTGDAYKGPAKASMLITAQDLFFTTLPATNAREQVNYTKDHLQADYQEELPLTDTKLAGHPFSFFSYWSPSAQLHWYVVATEIRCHTVEMVLTSRDTKLLGSLLLGLDKMTLPVEADAGAGTGGGQVPVCIKDYATPENTIKRVDPFFGQNRYNSVPVRVIIDKEGKVKHIHFLSAYPDQAQAITDALEQSRFKPYLVNGKPVEVETGILFGRPAYVAPRVAASAKTVSTD